MDYGLIIDSGFVLFGIGTIWLLILIFKESIAQGVITIWLLPLVYMFVKMNWRAARIPFAIHAIGITLLLYGQFADPAFNSKTNTVFSHGNQISIVIPKSWSRLRNLDKDAVIQAGNPVNNEYLVIYQIDKAKIPGISAQDIVYSVAKEISADLKEAKLGDPSRLDINGMKANRIEVHGFENNISLSYLFSVVDSNKYYYNVLTWTTGENYSASKAELIKVVGSLKRIDKKDSGK